MPRKPLPLDEMPGPSAEKIKEWERLCENVGFTYVGWERRNRYRQYVRFICKEHEYKGVQTICASNLKKIRPGHCACFHRNYTIEDLKRQPNLNKNVEILSDSFVDSSTKVKCKCRECGHIWWVTPNKLQCGKGCPICKWKRISENNSKTHKQFAEELHEKCPTLTLLDRYHRYYDKVHVLCSICGTISECIAGKILRGDDGCRKCRSSLGEQKIFDWLLLNNVAHKRQYMFNECVFKERLRFDFYLPEYNICIEYQGEQHYFPVNFRGHHYDGAQKDYEYLQKRDNIKREFCKNNDIVLIEIPYWEKDNIPTILSEKINVKKNP